MLPFILAVIGGYLIGDAVEPKKFKAGGLIAPNGKKSNLTPQEYKLVRTPEFKAWFGDWENSPETSSKVVDENGEPLICFHGRSSYFTEFTDKYAGKYTSDMGKLGFFFTNSYDLAHDFTKVKWYNPTSKQRKNANILECFLNIRNPELVDGLRFLRINDASDFKEYLISEKLKDGIIISPMEDEDLKNLNLIYDGIKELQFNQYACFYPNQIKLADGTNTTFDSSNPDIRYLDGGTVGTHKEFIKEVYELAKFNSKLTKGYKNTWSEYDFKGYKYKNEQLHKLALYAVNNGLTVFRFGNVIYFVINEIQISFHYTDNTFDFVPIKKIEWDRVKNAHTYTKKEYFEKKELAKNELIIRKIKLIEAEKELRNIADLEIEKLEKSKKIMRKVTSIKEVEKKINKLKLAMAYELFEYYKYSKLEVINKLRLMYQDDYINTFSI